MSEVRVSTRIPAAVLSPNSRCHWRVKRRAVKQLRDTTSLAAEIVAATMDEPWHAVNIQANYYYTCRRRRDPDNLIAMLKPAIDGLVVGGVLVDDDQITYRPPAVIIDNFSGLELVVSPTPGGGQD